MSGDHNMNQKRMRTHKDKLMSLLEYMELNHKVARRRLFAEQAYDAKDEKQSWEWLLFWCEAKDERAEMWKWFKKEYPDASMLKEGYYETYR